MHPSHLILAGVSILLLTGCPDDPPSGPNLGGETETTPPAGTTPPPEATVAQSMKNNVKFKRAERLRNDYTQALALPEDSLCFELGQYSCTDSVHRVALGDASAYTQGVYEPAKETGVTAPLIVERVAHAACAQRVELDFAYTSAAVIFEDLPVDSDGNLSDPQSDHVAGAVTRLFRRLMLRNPRQEEIDRFVAAYDDIAAIESTGAARQWATVSCFAVATSIETLFY